MKMLLSDLNFGKKYIENIFEQYEILNISISSHKFLSVLKANENNFDFDALEKMNDILADNENLIEKFYNLFIYDEKIISETLLNFSRSEIEIMFESIEK